MTNTISQYTDKLFDEYKRKFPKSLQAFEQNKHLFPNQVSHSGRFYAPFPVFMMEARGSRLTSIDGREFVDFWQGHFSNLFGHDEDHTKLIIEFLREINLRQTGQFHLIEGLLAEELRATTHHEQFIFTTSGSLATLYATLVGLSYTSRTKVLKLEGGWHGAQPYGLKGVRFPLGIDNPITEYSGICDYFDNSVLTAPMNDCERLEEIFEVYGDQLGVFILELVLGNSGMVLAKKEFIKVARRLTEKYGCILVIDELVTGFRVKAGLMSDLYGIKSDISTLGKSISGGFPFACIAGRKELFKSINFEDKLRLGIDAGTFSSHPVSIFASLKMVEKMRNDTAVFQRTIDNMDYLRKNLREVLKKNNITVDITGESSDTGIPNFPIGTIRFIKNLERYDINNPISHWDTNSVDIFFRNNVSKIALILKGYFTWQGLGVMTDAINKQEIDLFIQAYDAFGFEISKYCK